MSVARRADGRWLVKFKQHGKWIQKTFRDEATATSFDEAMNAPTIDSRPSVMELAVSFFRSHPEYHATTRSRIEHFINGYTNAKSVWVDGIGQFLRDKYAEDLTRADLEMMREVMRQRGSGNATINKMQAYIRAILAWGVDQQIIRFNPWRDYKRLPAKKMEITATLDDFQHILKFCPDWLRWALATAYALAMRPGHVELFSLTWAAFNWRHGYVQYAQGKSGRVKRVVPPPAYWMEAQRRFAEDSAAGIPWVCHRLGRQVHNYRSAWDRAKKRAGFAGRCIRPYDIRHAAASEMLAAGADLAAVAAQMGHASIQTTATTYAHVTPGGQKRAADLLPSLVQFGAGKSPHD